MRPSVLALQRLVLRTERGPLRPLWRLAYALLALVYAWWLRGATRDATVYLRGGRSPVYGLSDIDPAVVVPADPEHPGRPRRRVLARRESLGRWARGPLGAIFDAPYVIEADALAASAPTQVHGLGDPPRADAPLYHGRVSRPDVIRLAENPGLYGLAAGWRRVAGNGPRELAEGARDAQHRRLAAWLEVQAAWRWFLQGTGDPTSPRWADLCVKAVAEPARAWLWLSAGERTDGRRQTLERALERMPEEEAPLRAALALECSLHRGPGSEDFAAHAVRMTTRVATLLTEQVAEHGTTDVGLSWGGQEQLVLPPNAAFRLDGLVGDAPARLLPYVDWRALTGAWIGVEGTPGPALLDETLAPLALDPGHFADLTAGARGGDAGPYPALRRGDLLVTPAVPWPRTHLRAVACPLTDPVSLALLDGREVAAFPAVEGWSAWHTARRAVAEHAAGLTEPAGDPGRDLGMAIGAARAGLFLDSLEDAQPELTLTAAATLRRLGDPGEAEDAYRRFVLEGEPPGRATAAALREAVGRLPAYRRHSASPGAGRRAGDAGRGRS